MIVTTTHTIEGHRITAYHGVIIGEAMIGAEVVRDMFAGTTHKIGNINDYEDKLIEARAVAFRELEKRSEKTGANAVVGVDFDYEVLGVWMLMVSVSGTAVTIEEF